jgi:hypothetical protein
MKDGGLAFPCVEKKIISQNKWREVDHLGMSLRDYFAGQALVGLASLTPPCMDNAYLAYKYADAMLEEREHWLL